MTDEAKKILEALRTTDEQCYAYKNCEDCIMYEYCFTEQDKSIEKDAADLIERMSAEPEQVKRERDAAIQDLCAADEMTGICPLCKNMLTCSFEQKLAGTNCYEWRGVCAENSVGVE